MRGLHLGQLRGDIIYPTLHHLGLWSIAAENLIVGTISQESGGGYYIKQLGSGPALGICQMEPATHNDIWANYLVYHTALAEKAGSLVSARHMNIVMPIPNPNEMVTNLAYSVAMCRIHYRRVKKPLPAADDIPGLAAYWKRHYNTTLGDGTVAEFIHNYNEYNK